MALIIPEVIIKEYVDVVLKVVRDDYKSIMNGGSGIEADTLLYKILGSVAIFNYELFDQAKTVVLAGADSPRYIKTFLSYNPEDTTYPSIHVSLPSESSGLVDGLGMGEGDVDDNDTIGTNRQVTFNRSFNGSYNLVILSDNRNEITLLYHLIRAGMIALQDSMELSGLQNIKFGGMELSFPNRMPPGLFTKIITLSCFYDTNVPAFNLTPVITKINLLIKAVDKLT